MPAVAEQKGEYEKKGAIMGSLPSRRLRACALAVVGFTGLAFSVTPSASASGFTSPIQNGDVMVSVSNGQVQDWTPNGTSATLSRTLDTGHAGAYTTGSTFDNSGNFYVTGFNANTVTKFDPNGNLIGDFGSGYNADPESILFNKAGTNVFVGQADGSHQVLQFDSAGNPVASFAPATEDRGTDWIDLSADECTVFYTSEGQFVHSYNVCTSTQGPDVNSVALTGPQAYAFRKIPATSSFDPNGFVIADSTAIAVLDSSGNLLSSYTFPGESNLFALNLDPDGTSAWTGDFGTADVIEFNLATGAVERQFNTGTGTGTVFGISVKGEITSGGGGGGGGGTEQPITATGGQALTGVESASVSGTVATFTDPDAAAQASDYSASIDWGDGSSAGTGTITKNQDGSFSVSGSHTYADEGSYTIKATITDTGDASNTATVTDTANVSDASLAPGSISSPGPVIGQSVSLNAGFSDADTTTSSAADFTATVDWGDGNTTNGTVGGSGGSYSVTGSHTYTGTGFYTIKVHVADDGGSTVNEQKTVLIYATSAGGNFVISSQKAATGTPVTFWGAQWTKLNPVAGAPPASFKGFEDQPKAPLCGQNWQTDPGNSTPPPNGPLPAYLLVLVSSSISSTPSNAIKGNTVHEVVVKTNPGYGPQPSTPGTGTVVATVC